MKPPRLPLVSAIVRQLSPVAAERALSQHGAFPAQLRGFGPVGIAAIAVILASSLLAGFLGALLVLLWVQWSETPWRDVGYVRPRSWAASAALGVLSGIAFKLLMKSVVMPLLGAEPVNHAYHYLAGNRAAIPVALFTFIVVAGFGEETLFRGYMFERLGRLLGSGAAAKAAAVIVTSAIFAAAHYADQGVVGVEQAAITGLVFGSVFAASGRIFAVMCAHAAFDLTAYAIIYWGLELRVAHLVFR